MKGKGLPIALMALLLLAFALRLLYMERISLYIDEFVTMWVAKMILRSGLPRTPAGVIYNRGILFSYLDTLFIYLFGFSEKAARIPSVLLGALTVPLLYFVGSRLRSSVTGLVACALLTFAPDAILWGGRARMYTLLQLFVLLASFSLYQGVIKSQSRGYRYLFLLSFWGAVFTQAEAILLYPAFLLAIIAWRGMSWLWGRRGLLVNGLCLLAIVSRYLFDKATQPGQLETIQRTRPYLQFSLNLLGRLRPYRLFFLDSVYLPLTILFFLGLIYLLKRGVSRENPPRALLFLYLIFSLPMLELVIFAGATWRDPRYLFMLLPLFFLIIADLSDRSLGWMVDRLSPSRWREALSRGGVYLLIGGAFFVFLPGVRSLLSTQIEGYDRALYYVRHHWQEGDLILMASPPVSAVYLGKCDYYAIQRDYEEYVIRKDGVLIDRWVGAPLLNSTQKLEELLKENRRVWFVIDIWRLATHYDMDFRRLIAEGMETVHEVQGVRILLAQGYEEPQEPAINRSLQVNLDDKIALLGYDLSTDRIQPGQEVWLALYWQALAPLREEYTVFVHLLDRENSPGGQDDAPPMKGLYPTIYWREEEIVPDEHRLLIPADVSAGRYLLEVGIHSSQTGDRLPLLDSAGNPGATRVVLDYVKIGREESPSPQRIVEADFGGLVRLLGYDLEPTSLETSSEPGESLDLTIYWQVLAPLKENYTVFVHLLDQEGRIWGQQDSQPLAGFYPTSFWHEGEIVRDGYQLRIDSQALGGEYETVVGIYLLATGERLPVQSEGETRGWLPLTTVWVERQ